MTTIPDEVIEAAYDRMIRMKSSLEWGVTHEDAAAILEAAYPAIRKQVRAEMLEEWRQANGMLAALAIGQEEAADAE